VNVAAPLAACSKQKQIFGTWAEGAKMLKFAHVYVLSMQQCCSGRSVYAYIEMFKKGWTSMTVAEHSGHSSTSTSSEILEEARAMAAQNRRVGILEIAQKLNVSQG
jgi:hypothetical protein